MIWSLVIERIATLEEIETFWSLDDVLRATALLDCKAYIQREAQKKGK